MLQHSVTTAWGFLILSFMTWSITFAFIVFGVMLRKKILLWDANWKETVEASGTTIREFAEDLERSFEKIRSTFRLLGFFVFVIIGLMGLVGYLGLLEKPILGHFQVASSLWLLTLVALSVILPAFINFGMGTYVAETMLLKANAFVFEEVREEMREKKAKLKMMEKVKEMRSQREALKNAKPEAAPAPEPPKPEEPKDAKGKKGAPAKAGAKK